MRVTVPYSEFKVTFELAARAAKRSVLFRDVKISAGTSVALTAIDQHLRQLTTLSPWQIREGQKPKTRLVTKAYLLLDLPSAIVETPGSAVLDTRMVNAALDAGKHGDTVTISSSGDKTSITVAGNSFPASEYVSSHADTYPGAPVLGDAAPATITLSTALLAHALKVVSPTISTDAGRPNITGVSVKAGLGTAIFVSTDGHRLTKVTVPAEIPDGTVAILPPLGVELMQRIITGAETEITLGKLVGHLSTPAFGDRGAVHLWFDLIDETFPDYNRVIPAISPSLYYVKGKDLYDAVTVISKAEKAMAKVKKSRSALIFELPSGESKLRIFGESVKEANPGDFTIALVPLEGRQAVRAFQATYNPDYWLDLCDVIEEPEYSLELVDELSPTVIRAMGEPAGIETLFVIMPMRR